MKRIYFLTMLCIVFVSCNNDELSKKLTTKTEVEVLEFASEEKMEQKVNEIITIKSEIEKKVLENFNKKETSKDFNLSVTNKNNKTDIEEQNKAIYNSVKTYHELEISGIYELRKMLNFTSIQSIADEINSLVIVDPNKAKYLTKTYNNLLIKTNIGEVKTIFDERTSNVLNAYGNVLINGKKMDYKVYSSISNENSETRKYIGDEFVINKIAVIKDDYMAQYSAGREIHRNDLGFKFFRYFTELRTLLQVQVFGTKVWVPYPSNFDVDPSSKAGFALSNTATIGDYSFTYSYISGEGNNIRNTGGKKNNAYVPVGGSLKATFSTNVGNEHKEMNCDLTYQEE